MARPQTRSVGYPEKARARIHGSKALTYLVSVADGKVEPDAVRVQACRYLVDKVLPNPPQELADIKGGSVVVQIVRYSSDPV